MRGDEGAGWLLPRLPPVAADRPPIMPAVLTSLPYSPHAPPSHCRSDLLLAQLWPALPAEERQSVLARLAAAEGREKLPAVQALAAQLAAKLRKLQ